MMSPQVGPGQIFVSLMELQYNYKYFQLHQLSCLLHLITQKQIVAKKVTSKALCVYCPPAKTSKLRSAGRIENKIILQAQNRL
ncbi:hypothetical protein CSKR_202236 [Clonorchis sinensis]|uniref:Uncharacterized protein n=1 Tax=Clonorchis sinensis TaxID=79923 RepID=A0A8T1LWJ7_CLOSI|nr:hypothetical protein CSKR_202236 [Clonorchis sinensis]